MSDESRIRINALLLQREELFVRVHGIEHAVNDILGEPWPFDPPALPSMRRAKKPKAVKKRPTAKAKPDADEPKLRKLDETTGETAYRVTYLQRGQNREEVHDTPEALQTLIAAQNENLRVLAIDILNTEGDAVDRLFPADGTV